MRRSWLSERTSQRRHVVLAQIGMAWYIRGKYLLKQVGANTRGTCPSRTCVGHSPGIKHRIVDESTNNQITPRYFSGYTPILVYSLRQLRPKETICITAPRQHRTMEVLWDASAVAQVYFKAKRLLYQSASIAPTQLSCARISRHTLHLQQVSSMVTEPPVITDAGFRQQMEEVYNKVCLTSSSWVLSSHADLYTGRDT
jgi:hypothetical protein